MTASRLARVGRGVGAEMATDREVVGLLLGLADLLATRLTRAGHLAQVVTQEHRGNCPPTGECTPACTEAIRLMARVADIAEAYTARQTQQPRAVQPDLFEAAAG